MTACTLLLYVNSETLPKRLFYTSMLRKNAQEIFLLYFFKFKTKATFADVDNL